MSLEKDIAMMVMLKKVKEMNMVNVVQNKDSFYQMLNTELEDLQEKLQQHIGIHYVLNYISSIPAIDYVYAYLYRNQELVISSVDLHPDNSDLYDNDSNFGKCELQKEDVQAWYEKCNYIRTVRFKGIVKPITCAYWFSGCKNLTEIKNIQNLNTSECTDMSFMFEYCESFTTLDVSNFDTGKVTDMYAMFNNCTSLTTLDLSNFDTSNVINMYCMFFNCKSLTTLDVSNFDTGKVTDMDYMFYNCKSLTILDLSSFDTSKVTDMDWMFTSCPNLTSITCTQSTKDKIISMENTKIPSTVTWTII